MRKLHICFFLLGLALLALIIAFSNPAKLVEVLSGANYYYFIAAVAISTASIYLTTMKWQVLLGKMTVMRLMPITILGSSISNLTPGKITEPIKSVLLKMDSGIAVSTSLPSIIWDRVSDVVAMLVLSMIIIGVISVNPQISLIAWIGIAIFVAVIAVVIFSMYSKPFGMKLFSVARKFPVIRRISADFMENFYSIQTSKKRISLSVTIALIVWFLQGVVMYLCLAALGINSNPFVLAGIIAFSILIGIASSLPGGIGSTEFVMILLLGAYGIPAEYAVASTFAYRFASFWYGLILGGISFVYLSRRLNLKFLMP